MSLLSLAFLLTARQAPSAAFEIPFKVAEDAIVLDASVNGAAVSLMLDTGFSGSVILKDGIDVGKPTGTRELRDFVGKFTAATVALRSLEMGGHPIKTEDDEIITQQLRNLSIAYGTHVDGILGLGALRGQVFEINFERKVIRVFPSSTRLASLQPKAGTVAATLLPIGHSSLELTVETGSAQKLTMSIDTGNAFYATTHTDVLERVGLWSAGEHPKFMRISGVASGAVQSWAARMKGLKIFGVAVADSVWDIIDLPSSAAEADGTVGFQFLRNFNITVDFPSRIVWLDNFSGKVSDEVKGDVGLVSAYSPTLRRMSVLGISPESPAAQAGLQEGDEVIAVNGRDLVRESYLQMRHLLEGAPGSSVNLEVLRNGNLMRFQLKRQLLVNEVGPPS